MTSRELVERKQEAEWLRGQQTMFTRREPRYCRHDHMMVQAIGPARWWQWTLPAIALVGFLVLIAIVMFDPIGIFALIAAGLLISVLGPYIALSRQPLKCPHCHREAPFHTKAEADAEDQRDAERRAALAADLASEREATGAVTPEP